MPPSSMMIDVYSRHHADIMEELEQKRRRMRGDAREPSRQPPSSPRRTPAGPPKPRRTDPGAPWYARAEKQGTGARPRVAPAPTPQPRQAYSAAVAGVFPAQDVREKDRQRQQQLDAARRKPLPRDNVQDVREKDRLREQQLRSVARREPSKADIEFTKLLLKPGTRYKEETIRSLAAQLISPGGRSQQASSAAGKINEEKAQRQLRELRGNRPDQWSDEEAERSRVRRRKLRQSSRLRRRPLPLPLGCPFRMTLVRCGTPRVTANHTLFADQRRGCWNEPLYL